MIWLLYKQVPKSDNEEVGSIQNHCKNEIWDSEPSDGKGNLYLHTILLSKPKYVMDLDYQI